MSEQCNCRSSAMTNGLGCRATAVEPTTKGNGGGLRMLQRQAAFDAAARASALERQTQEGNRDGDSPIQQERGFDAERAGALKHHLNGKGCGRRRG